MSSENKNPVSIVNHATRLLSEAMELLQEVRETTAGSDRLLKPAEVARQLGVSFHVVSTLITKGDLAAVQCGTTEAGAVRIRISEASLRDYMARNKYVPVPEQRRLALAQAI